MFFSIIPWYAVLIWAVIATIFYRWRYKDFKWLWNPYVFVGVFLVNLLFFAPAAAVFLVLEIIRAFENKAK